MSKLIFIVGLTATGKTSLALQLVAEAITGGLFTGADIVSADSRQVFEGLKIVSGADVPEGFKSQIPSTKSQANDKFQSSNYKYYQNDDGIKLHGISIIKLKDEWSVAHFVKLASEVFERAKKAKRLVIIVGGTGLYHQKLWEAWETRSLGRQETGTLGIKPDYQLRKKLEKLELSQLQNKLQKLDPEKWEQMNRSDKMNPRRLVRAIEIALQKSQNPKSKISQGSPSGQANFKFQKLKHKLLVLLTLLKILKPIFVNELKSDLVMAQLRKSKIY